MNHCASCGYGVEWHDLGTKRCPIETANKSGARGTWRDPPPPETLTYEQIMKRDALARRAAIEEAHRSYVSPVTLAPIVPARPPYGPHEFAGYGGRQAVGLGRKAVALGWEVSPWYWLAGDEHEGCALRLGKGPLRAVACWTRKAGNKNPKSGWSADVAYAWRIDIQRIPTKLNHTELEGLIA
jgi:hypothetical protein